MMTEESKALVRVDDVTEIRRQFEDPGYIQKIKDIYFKGADDIEFQLCVQTCKRLGLDPFARQIYFIPVWDKDLGRYKLIPCVSIDGLRTCAERTGEYRGQTPPQWCGPDGVWVDVWLHDAPPAAARVGALREGFQQPTIGVVRYKSFVKTARDGRPLSQWATMPDHMLAKCAEAQALRKAFPRDLGGDFVVEDAEPNEEAQALQAPDDIVETLNAIRNAQTLDDLDQATARLKGAPMDEDAKDAARRAWHESSTRIKKTAEQEAETQRKAKARNNAKRDARGKAKRDAKSEAKPNGKTKAQPEPEPEPQPEAAAEPGPYDFGPPPMTDAELDAVETGKQSGFGFGGKTDGE